MITMLEVVFRVEFPLIGLVSYEACHKQFSNSPGVKGQHFNTSWTRLLRKGASYVVLNSGFTLGHLSWPKR